MSWGNGQFYMAPRVDMIRDLGVNHWVDLGIAHGFVGPHIQCAGLPLNRQGMRSLVKSSSFSWIWVWPDANFVPPGSIGIPDGGLMGDTAKRYYDKLAFILEPAGVDRYGLSVGSDVLEWVGGGDLVQATIEITLWTKHMQDLLGAELLVGARSSLDAAWPGSYAGWGHHFDDKSTIDTQVSELIDKSGGQPCLAGEDRLRDRTPRRAKDFTQAEQLEAMPVFIDQGVGAIWGVLGADSDGRHESGTLAWDDPAAVRAILEGSPPPPNGSTCDDVADQSATEMARHAQAMQAIEVLTRALCATSPPLTTGKRMGLAKVVKPRI